MAEYALRIDHPEAQRYQLMAYLAREHEREYWDASGITAGADVVDIGCGPGEVTSLVAERVGTAGSVVGVDSDPETLDYAEYAKTRDGRSNVTIVRADAACTGLSRGDWDVAMARHVLVHNGGREQKIVNHMTELIHPGGHVYLAEFEGTAARIRPFTPDLDDLAERYGALHRRNGNDFAIGLRLRDLLINAGLEVQIFAGLYRIVEPPPGIRTPTWAARQAIVDAGLAGPEDVERWDRAFTALDELDPRPTIFFPVFVAIGRKPY